MRQSLLMAASGVALAAGVALYALLRPEGLQAGVWLGALWPSGRVWTWRGDWASLCAGSLPGGLWMLSATAIQAAIWAERPGRARCLWIVAPLAVGIGWELAQAAGALGGTFDPLDLIAYSAGWALVSSKNGCRTGVTTGTNISELPREFRATAPAAGKPDRDDRQ